MHQVDSLYIVGVWIRQPKELRMKRLLGLLLLIHSRTATTVPSPKV